MLPEKGGTLGTRKQEDKALNYLAEIIAFEQWLEIHYLPISSQLLWYKLMFLCNRAGWSEWVSVDNLRLMAAMQMSREATLIKARDELIKAGLVEYQRGKKGSPNKYHMVSISKNTFKNVVKSVAQSEVENVVKSVVESEVQSVAIYKHKQKQKDIPPISPGESFEQFWQAYPNKIRKQMAMTAFADLIMSGTVLAEDLIQAAKNYAEACGIEKTSKLYHPHNFLDKGIFEDYLPENYRKPEVQRSSGTGFSNFQERDYDFDELEKQLLNADRRDIGS